MWEGCQPDLPTYLGYHQFCPRRACLEEPDAGLSPRYQRRLHFTIMSTIPFLLFSWPWLAKCRSFSPPHSPHHEAASIPKPNTAPRKRPHLVLRETAVDTESGAAQPSPLSRCKTRSRGRYRITYSTKYFPNSSSTKYSDYHQIALITIADPCTYTARSDQSWSLTMHVAAASVPSWTLIDSFRLVDTTV